MDERTPEQPEPELDEAMVPRPVEATPETAPSGPFALAGMFVTGFAMGAADVVPGFSGGTVALVAGIYERLVANIRQGVRTLSLAVRGRTAAAREALFAIEWPFLVTLLVGIATAIFTLAATLNRLLTDEPVAMSAVFLGLVLGATAVATGELRVPALTHGVVVVVVAVLVFIGLGSSPGTITDPSLPIVFGAAAVAVCAMILPGVSGSFLLLVFGLYEPVTAAVRDLDVPVLLAVLLGGVSGLAAFSTLLNWLLRRFHDLVLAALLGLMLGSVRILWPWPSDAGVGNPALGPPEGNEWLLALALALGAFGVVWIIGLLVTSLAERERVS